MLKHGHWSIDDDNEEMVMPTPMDSGGRRQLGTDRIHCMLNLLLSAACLGHCTSFTRAVPRGSQLTWSCDDFLGREVLCTGTGLKFVLSVQLQSLHLVDKDTV